MPPFDVIGLGALNVDRIYSVPRVVTDGSEVIQEGTAAAGGSAANTVYGLAKLGLRCGFVGAVGDEGTEIVLDSFAEVGVDTSRIVRKPGASTDTVFAFADPMGRRAMYVYPGANALFASGDVDAAYLANCRLLVTSSFAGDVPLTVQKAAVGALPPANLLALSLDAFWARVGLEGLAELVARSTIVFANADELGELTGRGLPASAEVLLALGCRTVAVTFGSGAERPPWMTVEPQGLVGAPIVCWIASADGQQALAAHPTHEGAVVDGTGAGDAFAAGFLWGYLAGEPLLRCASLGHVAAGFCLERMGCRAGLPTREALLARHARHFS
ncbi:MAG TPA: carbohydrate kinase family protein [Dehalococcoidia bacterium]|nr:carbohydrate kinase family protein [Dehalococcoidia bacterium]